MSDRAAHWQRLLREWEHSGLSQAEFCRRQRVNAVTFAWWKRRLRQSEDQADGPRAGRARRSGFVEVTLPRDTAVPAIRGARLSPVERYELVLPGGVGRALTVSHRTPPAHMLPKPGDEFETGSTEGLPLSRAGPARRGAQPADARIRT